MSQTSKHGYPWHFLLQKSLHATFSNIGTHPIAAKSNQLWLPIYDRHILQCSFKGLKQTFNSSAPDVWHTECVMESNFTIGSEWIKAECQKHFNLNIPSICAGISLEGKKNLERNRASRKVRGWSWAINFTKVLHAWSLLYPIHKLMLCRSSNSHMDGIFMNARFSLTSMYAMSNF